MTPGLGPGVAAVILTQTIAAVGTMAVVPSLPFFALNKLGASAVEVSMLGACYNFTQMLCSPAIGSLSDRIGRKWVMLGGLLLQALCNCVQAEVQSPAGLLMARAMVGAAISTGPVEMAYIMDFTQSEADLGHTLALQRMCCNAGALLGPLIARSMEPFGFPLLSRGLACINLICLLLGAFLWEGTRQIFAAEEDAASPASVSSAIKEEEAGSDGEAQQQPPTTTIPTTTTT
ncbi:unnamed protein product, partial [Polarella glacialis]